MGIDMHINVYEIKYIEDGDFVYKYYAVPELKEFNGFALFSATGKTKEEAEEKCRDINDRHNPMDILHIKKC